MQVPKNDGETKGRLFSRVILVFSRLAYERPLLIVFLTACVAAYGVWGVGAMQIDPDMKALLPQDYPTITRLQALKERIGNQSDLLVVIKSEDRAANIAYGKKLVEKLRTMEEFRYLIFRRDLSFFVDRALLYSPVYELLRLRKKVIRRIRKETAKKVVIDFEDDDDEEEEPTPGTKTKKKKDTFDLNEDDLMARYLGGAVKSGKYLEADKGRILVIKGRPTEPTTDVDFSARLVTKVKAAIHETNPTAFHPKMLVSMQGGYKDSVRSGHEIARKIIPTVAFAGLILLAIVGVYFRQLRALPIVFLPVVVATVATVATGALIFPTFNLVTTFIFAILLGLGIDFSIHAYARYDFERRRGWSLKDALDLALTSTGSALFAGAATTAAVFFLLIVGRFRGFSQFGAVAGIGVIFALLATFTLVPALVVLFERLRPCRYPPSKERAEETTDHAEASRSQRKPLGTRLLAGTIILGSIGFAVFSLLHLQEIGFEYDFTRLIMPKSVFDKPIDNSPKMDFREAAGRATTNAPAVALCKDQATCVRISQMLNAVMRADKREIALLRGQKPQLPVSEDDEDEDDADEAEDDLFGKLQASFGLSRLMPAERATLKSLGVDRVLKMRHYLKAYLGLQTLLPSYQEQKLAIIADIRRRIQKKRAFMKEPTREKLKKWEKYIQVDKAITVEMIPNWISAQLREQNGVLGRNVVLYLDGIKADYSISNALYQAFFHLPDPSGRVKVAANYFILVEAIDTLRADGPRVLIATVGAVFICLMLLFRSLKATLLVLIPLALSIIWLGGVYWLAGWKLNMFSVVAFPLLVGMGIDNAIHVYHRFSESGRVRTVLREVGGPVVTATTTTFVGFFGLLFTDYWGIQTLGLTAGLGMWLVFFGAVFTLLSVLHLFGGKAATNTN
jgi:uncharacterized protein